MPTTPNPQVDQPGEASAAGAAPVPHAAWRTALEQAANAPTAAGVHLTAADVTALLAHLAHLETDRDAAVRATFQVAGQRVQLRATDHTAAGFGVIITLHYAGMSLPLGAGATLDAALASITTDAQARTLRSALAAADTELAQLRTLVADDAYVLADEADPCEDVSCDHGDCERARRILAVGDAIRAARPRAATRSRGTR